MFYGWWMVIASFFLYVYFGGTVGYGFTAFFNPIMTTFGWTRAEISLGFSLRSIEIGLLDPFIGMAIDRFGPRRAILLGITVAGLALVLLSRIRVLWELYAALMLLAVGTAFAAGIPQYTAIANWFLRRRSFAMGILSLGFGVSGVLVPIVALLIAGFGWRRTLLMVGIGLWLLGIPLAFVFRHRPEDYGLLPDGERLDPVPSGTSTTPSNKADVSSDAGLVTPTYAPGPELSVRESVASSALWLLMAFGSLLGLAQGALGLHEMPYLISIGISTELAALTMTGITVSSLIGRLGFAWLGDRYDKRRLLAVAASLQTIGILIFAAIQKPWHIIPFLLTYGPGYAGPIPLSPALQADYFGTRTFATLRGFMALSWVPSGFIAPLFAGWVCDVTGSYRLAWLVFAIAGAFAIPIAFVIRPPRQKPGPFDRGHAE